MKCSDVELIISAWLDDEIEPSTWQAAQTHIAGCERCARTLALFSQSTAFVRREMPPQAPSHNLWVGVKAEITRMRRENSPPRQRTIRLLVPGPRIRYALAGFAAASLLFAALLVSGRLSLRSGAPAWMPVRQIPAPTETGAPAVSAKARRQQHLRRAEATEEVQRFFDRAGLLLLEIKNAEIEQDTHALTGIRSASTNLLEKTAIIKRELQAADLNFLQSTVEQLEVTLFELANFAENPEQDFELIKASILKKDLLIKIEIIDLTKLRERESTPAANAPAGTGPHKSI